ncbi:MetQ/NlpA family ABC transporter substrate-binding protein [Brachyspira alvinipulli]|uniref:MetQ/NlpA family ABC transporter substrate-binding protein n=1 Tax=Brachyspira alvinipulli TaxID=84379 RepID=UPI0004898A0F|nr:MetQ/NlpA family ABC transporter substrate-binding protein [Brachyspira alvinipulli]
MYRKLFLIFLIIILFCFSSCADNNASSVKIGHIGEFDSYIWKSISRKLEGENITLELINFSDYSEINRALNNEYIDINNFQNYAYFVNETNKNDYCLSILEKTFIASMNMYSRNLTNVAQISSGAKIAVPDDYINFSRALKILDSIGFIRLKKNEKKDYNYEEKDIIENFLKLELVPTKANEIYSIIDDVDAAIVNYSLSFDFQDENILYIDDPSKYESDMYVNVVAARLEDENNEVYKKIASSYKERMYDEIRNGNIKGLIMVD